MNPLSLFKFSPIGAALVVALVSAVGAQADQSALLAAYATLEDHINGVSTLTASEINAQATIINSNAGNAGDNTSMINASFSLIETYESVQGALFVNGTTSGGFTRSDTSTANKALALAMLKVYQAIIDDAYNTWNLNNNRSALVGAKFESADYFPGAVDSPADPDAVYSVQINASQPEAWGYEVMFQYEAARRPTGAYLAPGDIATVTVPEALVGQGFAIRVGAHVADLSSKSTVKRIDRVSLSYSINSTTTEIASPLGGGIYIEVPYGVDAGLVTVEIQNAVRAPFYSNSSARQTTLAEWQNTERSHPGPWADFETDKFMLTLPTDWIYAFADPVSLMDNWDLAMDACSDMQGLPRVRPKTVLYCIIDVLMDGSAFSPGYPQSNDSWSPTSSAGGNKDHDYLNGPKFAQHEILHEFGHASYVTKFSGEMEATVNLFYVPVHNRMFNVPLDEAFGRSLNADAGKAMTRNHAALNWIVTEKFRNGEAMDQYDMKYQHRGYAKYVEIAALFGWDALGDFWKSVAVDYENGIEYSRNYDPADSRIIRMSRAAGANLLPLIHLWGVHPDNAASIESTLESEGIEPSAAIYDRLKYYQSIVPMSAASFKTHDNAIHNLISVNERDWYTSMRTDWTEAMGTDSVAAIQDILDAYFPNGRPIENLPHYEDFEDGIGGWAQATDDDFEWRRNSGGTASSAAGPDGASSGDYYMYAEGHDADGSNKTASFQCTFDFSARRETTLTFDYHMYGNYIEFLAVDVHDGTAWNNNVWIRNGKQHNASSDPWSTATVDLTDFSGNDEVTVRFRTQNGEWNSADPAIDNIRIDVGTIQLPYASGFESGFGGWEQSDDGVYDWSRNSGYTATDSSGPAAASEGSFYLYFEADNDYYKHNKIAEMEATFDLGSVDGAEFSFDYHMYGMHIDYLSVDIFDGTTWSSNVWSRSGEQQASSESAWSNAVIDLGAYAGNDAVTIRFRAKQKYWHKSDIAIDNVRIDLPPQTLPYAESFEDGIGAWLQAEVDDYDWTRNSGGTETAAAGPSGASDGDYYLYAEGHHGLGSYKTSVVYCAFNFSTVSAPELTFDYHMYGSYIDFLAVDVDDGSVYTSNVWIKVGKQHSSSEDPWSTATVDLSAYAGNDEVTICFRTANRLWNAADPAIDNIRLEETATAYGTWAAIAFAGAPDGTDTTASGNPDGDRFNNRLEWALVLDPLVADQPSMDVSMGDSDFTVIYSRRNSDDVAVFASWATSPTATVWRVAGDGLTESSVAFSNDVETMSATVPIDEDQKFIRLQAEK
ncbi:M60 family metallopeptidase [Pontiella sp.]|uniref:M60 family metallopeptidase n=1 Tax=Pontiella sp. TaxID=2837462 RepID=UPI0035669C4F